MLLRFDGHCCCENAHLAIAINQIERPNMAMAIDNC
jgi:hypothetical protein